MGGDHPRNAGNTTSTNTSSCASWDHPRNAGNTSSYRPSRLPFRDHPRNAGNTGRASRARFPHRDHPRNAGNTSRRWSYRHSRRDHPRNAGNTVKQLRRYRMASHFSITLTCWGYERPPYFLALRYLLAELQPFVGTPKSVASSLPAGRRINSTPSQSTGCQSG